MTKDRRQGAPDRAARGEAIAEYVFANGGAKISFPALLDLIAYSAAQAETMDIPTCHECGREAHWDDETQSWRIGCWECY